VPEHPECPYNNSNNNNTIPVVRPVMSITNNLIQMNSNNSTVNNLHQTIIPSQVLDFSVRVDKEKITTFSCNRDR
jgi:hypothetical protein